MATGKTRKGEYERISSKAARGKFSLVEPLDYMIMGALPDEGTLFAGLYPLGETAQNIVKKFPKGPDGATPPVSIITGRLHTLKTQGLIKGHDSVPGAASAVWQVTSRGKKLFNEWKEKQGGTATAK